MKRRPRPTALPFSTAALVDEELRARRRRRRRQWGLAARIFVLALVVMVGLVACAAVFAPCCSARFHCRSKQSEAKTNLKSLYVAQEVFRGEHDRYGSFEEIGWSPRGSRVRYRYALEHVGADSFRALAVGTRDRVAGDTWLINDETSLENLVNACR